MKDFDIAFQNVIKSLGSLTFSADSLAGIESAEIFYSMLNTIGRGAHASDPDCLDFLDDYVEPVYFRNNTGSDIYIEYNKKYYNGLPIRLVNGLVYCATEQAADFIISKAAEQGYTLPEVTQAAWIAGGNAEIIV